jgi:hypothetical protein
MSSFVISEDLKTLDTAPILDILGRRKSMQDALVWAEQALNHIKPGNVTLSKIKTGMSKINATH